MTVSCPAVLGVDGGNSKTELALVDADGRLLGTSRGPTVSHQRVPLDEAVGRLAGLVDDVLADAGMPPRAGVPAAPVGVYALAGADFPSDVEVLHRAIAGARMTEQTVVVNDTLAALRAGTDKAWGIALVCGHGVNGVGVSPAGATRRFDSLGDISGDWGGGAGIGLAAHAAAVRGTDGRGPATSLARLIPDHFGYESTAAVVEALYRERLDQARLGELAPLVFAAATAGDAVAEGIVLKQADELVVMARALAEGLSLMDLDVDVVLAGSVFKNEHSGFWRRLTTGVRAAVPSARLVEPRRSPAIGSALLGLDHLVRAREF